MTSWLWHPRPRDGASGALPASRAVLGCAARDAQNTHITPTSPSSRGPGHRPFTAVTRVRISVGTHLFSWELLVFSCGRGAALPVLSPQRRPLLEQPDGLVERRCAG